MDNNRMAERGTDEQLRAALHQSPDGLLLFDPAGTPVYMSTAAFGGSRLDECIHEEDRARVEESLARLRRRLEPFETEFRVVLPDGRTIWAEGKGYPVQLAGRPSLTAFSVRDITRRKQQEEQLARLAYYDALTGLPNRRLFYDRFMQSLISARRYRRRLALLYLDLDDFKRINDTYGHATGDELLVVAFARLTHSIREPDTVCRMGGDEFVVLLPHCEENGDVEKIARRIADALRQPFDLNGDHIRISSSIGAAIFPKDGLDGETLLRNADSAMYSAKLLGKNDLQFFS